MIQAGFRVDSFDVLQILVHISDRVEMVKLLTHRAPVVGRGASDSTRHGGRYLNP